LRKFEGYFFVMVLGVLWWVRGSRFFIIYLEGIFRRGREQKLKSESVRSSWNL